MTLAEQLSVTELQLASALKGKATKPSQTNLENTRPSAFLFRVYGHSTCVTITKIVTSKLPLVIEWQNNAVPTLENLVKKQKDLLLT